MADINLTQADADVLLGLLDPDATDPTGSHALSVLLTDQGVTVVRVTTAEAAASALRSTQNPTLDRKSVV